MTRLEKLIAHHNQDYVVEGGFYKELTVDRLHHYLSGLDAYSVPPLGYHIGGLCCSLKEHMERADICSYQLWSTLSDHTVAASAWDATGEGFRSGRTEPRLLMAAALAKELEEILEEHENSSH